jgi:hypothetical protein
MKTREFFGMLFLSVATIVPATASGGSDSRIKPDATDSAWQGAFNALNQNYSGEAKSYPGDSTTDNLETRTYSLTVKYEDVTPYVISANKLEDNPNYYYGQKNGTDRDTFLGFIETGSSTHSFPEKYLHQFAFPTPTKDISPKETIQGGVIRIHYTTADGKPKSKDIQVVIELRNCEAYSDGVWTPTDYEGEKPVGWTQN